MRTFGILEKIGIMDLDELQEKLGGISTYQIVLIATVSLLPFGTAFMSQTAVFFSAVPEYRCSVPPIDDPAIYPNLTEENITSLLIPTAEPCYRYDYNLSECNGDLSCLNIEGEPNKIACDKGFTYDKTYYEETTVSEWNLVCGRITLNSVANSVYFVGMFLGSGIVGPLMDWFGRRLAMLIMVILVIASGLGVTFSPSYEVYIAMRVLVAMSAVPCYLIYYTYVNEICIRKYRTITAMYANLVTAISHTLLPGIAFFLRDWRNLSLAVTLLNLPYLLVYFFIPRSPRWLLAHGHEGEARKTVEKYARSKKSTLDDGDWDCVLKTEKEKLKGTQEEKKYNLIDLFRPTMMRTVSFNAMYLWFVSSMIFYGLTLNVTALVGNPYVNATLNGFVEIIAYLGFLVFVHYIGMRMTSAVSFLFAGICCLATMLLTEFSDEHKDEKAMLDAARWIAILGKLFASMAFSIAYQYTAELYPTVARGTAISMGSMAARVGSIIMPFTLELQESIPWLTQTIFGALSVIAGATSLLLPETTTADLMTSINQAENFYIENMKFTAKLLGQTNKNRHRKSSMVPSDNGSAVAYELNFEKEEICYTHSTKI